LLNDEQSFIHTALRLNLTIGLLLKALAAIGLEKLPACSVFSRTLF
jgi:hypothetical protein